MSAKPLLHAKDYQLITQLRLNAKRRLVGLVTGEQRSPIRGGGIEFADYREYQPGDDIRQIDWAVFLRLRRLLVKLCAEEKELTLMLLLDNSPSMNYGLPDKFWQAARLAAVFAGIALHSGNRVGIYALGERNPELLPPFRQRSNLTEAVAALTRIEAAGPGNIPEAVRQFVTRYGRKCIWVLLSDLLYPEWPQVLNHLGAGGAEGYLIQVLAPEEIDPPFLGEITLVDQENQAEIPLHIGTELTKGYQKELNLFLAEIQAASRRWGMHHFAVGSDEPLDRIFRHALRKGGLIC